MAVFEKGLAESLSGSDSRSDWHFVFSGYRLSLGPTLLGVTALHAVFSQHVRDFHFPKSSRSVFLEGKENATPDVHKERW